MYIVTVQEDYEGAQDYYFNLESNAIAFAKLKMAELLEKNKLQNWVERYPNNWRAMMQDYDLGINVAIYPLRTED